MPFHVRTSSLIAATLFVIGSLGAQAEQIRVSLAAEPYPPFASKNADGQWVGFEVDLANAVCLAAKLDCKIVQTAWDGIIPALNSKKIDVIWASMGVTPDRSQQIAFTIPYYTSPAHFIGAKGDSFDFSPGGLKGKTIGVQTSTIYADYLARAYPEATVKTYSTQDAANADLVAGRLDLVLADGIALADFLNDKDGACCDVKNAPKDPIFDGGIAGGLRKSDIDLKAKLDAGITAVYKSGEFAKLEGKYFSFDIGTPPKD